MRLLQPIIIGGFFIWGKSTSIFDTECYHVAVLINQGRVGI